MILGSCVETTLPTMEESMVVTTPRNEVWLKTLKNSARNWVVTRSEIRVFLKRLKSQSLRPGPRRMPRPAVPKWPVASTKAALLNHACAVLGPFGLPTKSGRGETGLGSIPIPSGNVPAGLFAPHPPVGAALAKSKQLKGSLNWKKVKGFPDTREVSPETSQPPRTWPTNPCWLL